MAAGMIMAGLVLTGVGVANAAARPSRFVVITFLPAQHEVTLTIPTPPCKHGPPGCIWRLWVNEPFVPGAPALGSAVGTTGTLVVTYPATLCDTTVQGDASVTLQADVSVGGEVWRYKVGHRMELPACPTPGSTTTTTTPVGPGGTTTTTTVTPTTAVTPTTTATATATASPVATSTTDPTTPTKAVQTAAISQLPFTGIDLEPMALLGMASVLAGLLLATRLEQRRRALRRLHYTAQVQRVRALRASRWFLGE
jgi:hypothetical protein